MKVRKLSILIFKLKVLNMLCAEATIFIGTLGMFLIPTLFIWGIDFGSILFIMVCHYLVYIFKFRKIYREMLPEKRKIEDIIDILNKRKMSRQ